jgi:hypothetical protein
MKPASLLPRFECAPCTYTEITPNSIEIKLSLSLFHRKAFRGFPNKVQCLLILLASLCVLHISTPIMIDFIAVIKSFLIYFSIIGLLPFSVLLSAPCSHTSYINKLQLSVRVEDSQRCKELVRIWNISTIRFWVTERMMKYFESNCGAHTPSLTYLYLLRACHFHMLPSFDNINIYNHSLKLSTSFFEKG